MTKKIILLAYFICLIGILFSQDKNLPQERITVNKHYDENGNLISIDSSYTYIHSSTGKSFNRLDSLRNFPKIFNDFFSKGFDFFTRDTTFINFSKDIMERFNSNIREFESQLGNVDELKSKMDSIRQQMFKEFERQHFMEKKSNYDRN